MTTKDAAGEDEREAKWLACPNCDGYCGPYCVSGEHRCGHCGCTWNQSARQARARPTGEQHAEVGHVCGPEALKALKERKAKLDADRLDSTFDKAERWHAADYCLLARDAIAAFKAQLGSGEQPARGTLRDRAERVWKLCIADDDHVTADVIRELLDTAPPQTGVDRERLLALIRQCSETDLAWADDHKPWSEAQATAKARAESRLSEFLALLKGEK